MTPLTSMSADQEKSFRNAAIVKTRSGDYAIRASYDGVELGLKKVSKETAKTFFQLTDWKDKEAFLNMTARKTYEPGDYYDGQEPECRYRTWYMKSV